jgi:hypothetical protein
VPAWSAYVRRSRAPWQPDFYYHFDAFLGAARSVPDVIQTCFGWDDRSKSDWPVPPDAEEKDRRKKFQDEYTALYLDFSRLPLSRIRVGTFHLAGVPSVKVKARVFAGQTYTGGPRERVPDAASRQLPPETDPALAFLACEALPVEPSWRDFTLEVPLSDGTTSSTPLFAECRGYVRGAERLVAESREICARVHGWNKLTPPPGAREQRTTS